jgi:hypothetical protein
MNKYVLQGNIWSALRISRQMGASNLVSISKCSLQTTQIPVCFSWASRSGLR